MTIYYHCCFGISVCCCHGSLPQAVLAKGVLHSTDIMLFHTTLVTVLAKWYTVADNCGNAWCTHSLLLTPVTSQGNMLLFVDEVT